MGIDSLKNWMFWNALTFFLSMFPIFTQAFVIVNNTNTDVSILEACEGGTKRNKFYFTKSSFEEPLNISVGESIEIENKVFSNYTWDPPRDACFDCGFRIVLKYMKHSHTFRLGRFLNMSGKEYLLDGIKTGTHAIYIHHHTEDLKKLTLIIDTHDQIQETEN